ncbi:phosphonate C-P lyase system protein PhnH [Desulfosporosinus fructosivorans]|uniref:Phosphonate C-P lyase system protein PhnH n=1 Tax=Desulfosporosinus fructosivorans TaxID=2018669 RepID=A0A4Z0R8J1_9FIRM|nr:phosphonate C-P lyase system protein PhnH [Desulfosporosinus fructosivorans]TGE38745.1 phosphonate C-P lyase system protein PhnH [Desulfosporosinus fructosivorans]
MKLDLVHDLQRVYRKTLDSMSRPGVIHNFLNQADKLDMEEIGCFDATFLLVLMLLNTEVKFSVCSKHEAEMAKLVNQLTYAKRTEVQNAEYILVLQDAQPEELERALRLAYLGDLKDPHKAATIIIEADALSNERDLILTGPGIETESYVKVTTADCWVDLRADKNSEYPLGIDLIFTDPNNNILCLPRTVQILKQVVG